MVVKATPFAFLIRKWKKKGVVGVLFPPSTSTQRLRNTALGTWIGMSDSSQMKTSV